MVIDYSGNETRTNDLKLQEGKFSLDIRKDILALRVVSGGTGYLERL